MMFGLTITKTEIAGSIISKLVQFIIVKFMHKFSTHNPPEDNIPLKYWSLLFVFPVSSIFIVFCVFLLASKCNNDNAVFIAMICSIIFIPLNLAIFQIYDKFVKESEIRRMNLVYRQQISIYDKQIAEQDEAMFGLRRVKHDMKVHLFALHQMAMQGEFHQISQYIDQLIEDNRLYTTGIAQSGNRMIDALINYQFEIAQKRNISFSLRLEIPYKLEIEDADLYIILGNALENAIEASEKVIPEHKRFIRVSIVYKRDILFIGIENSFAEALRRNRHGKILSSKEDAQYHGIGLFSIKSAVEKYSGFLEIYDYNNVFSLIIQLNDKKNDMK